MQNIKAFADAVQKAKPAGRQGHLHQPGRDLLDHGAGVKVEPASLFGAAIAGPGKKLAGRLPAFCSFGAAGDACFILAAHLMEVGVMLSAMNRLRAWERFSRSDPGGVFAEQKDAQRRSLHDRHDQRHDRRNVGSILLDKCTGNSWVLADGLGDGRETTRWFPLTVETVKSSWGVAPALDEVRLAEAERRPLVEREESLLSQMAGL